MYTIPTTRVLTKPIKIIIFLAFISFSLQFFSFSCTALRWENILELFCDTWVTASANRSTRERRIRSSFT